MRITKEPDQRKQEILDTAVKLFHKKGYEKTSITDIAKAIGVAQGLCYRYFPSKEALFDSALDQYAQLLADRLSLFRGTRKQLKDIIADMPASVETDDSPFYHVLHQAENKKFHDQLALKVCEKVLPIVTDLLTAAKSRGEVHLEDPETAASFCVYGQLGILMNHQYTAEEKTRRIRDFLLSALNL